MDNVVEANVNNTIVGFLSTDDLALLKPVDLNDKLTFTKILIFVRELDTGNEILQSKEAFDILTSLMRDNQTLEKNFPLFRDYFSLLTILKANFLSVLDSPAIEQFLRESALGCISISVFSFRQYEFEFSLKQKLQYLLDYSLWYFDKDNKDLAKQSLTKALEQNIELLGGDGITTEERAPFEQTMANWIKLYNESAHPSMGAGRTSFDRLRFINTNKIIGLLDADQKNLLDHFLALYDWLRFEWKEDRKSEERRRILDNLADQDYEPPRTNNQNLNSSQAPARPTAPVFKSMQDMQRPVANNQPSIPPLAAGPPARVINQSTSSFPSNLPPVRAMNVQDLLKNRGQDDQTPPGLRIGGVPGNLPVASRTPQVNQNMPKPPQTLVEEALDIDKKLEQLRNKANRKT